MWMSDEAKPADAAQNAGGKDELDQILESVSEAAPQEQTAQESADQFTLPDGTVVTREELIKGYLRQSDYTRKTQALSEKARQAEAYEGLMKWFAQHPKEAEWLRRRLAGEEVPAESQEPEVSPDDIREEKKNLYFEFLEIEEDLHGKKLTKEEKEEIARVAYELQSQVDYEVPLKIAYEVWKGRRLPAIQAQAEKAGFQKAAQAKRGAVLPPAQGGEIPKPKKSPSEMSNAEWRQALAEEIDRMLSSG